jgi:broad specificity phosphatase PhoE
MKSDSEDRYEELEGSLDPRRSEDQRAAAEEAVARLRARGMNVASTEAPEDLADLLTAVERFEAAVEAHGGDLMVDDLKSSEPDDPHFVLPRRGRGESVRVYIGRIDAAIDHLRRHPRNTD